MLPRMGEIIARNMLSWLELLINRYCYIWLVVYIIVLVRHGRTNIKFWRLGFEKYELVYQTMKSDTEVLQYPQSRFKKLDKLNISR